MNTTPAQVTEAHRALAMQIREAFARSGNVSAAQLIADSEARALSVVCGRHNALIAERDQLRAELANERARLDWILKLRCEDETRVDIDAAMQEDAK